MRYSKTLPIISQEDFLNKARIVRGFTSSNGKRYMVDSVEGDEMNLIRLDAEWDGIWTMDLREVYYAYCELEDFQTKSFKNYVPRCHSPARGLLLHLGLLY